MKTSWSLLSEILDSFDADKLFGDILRDEGVPIRKLGEFDLDDTGGACVNCCCCYCC